MLLSVVLASQLPNYHQISFGAVKKEILNYGLFNLVEQEGSSLTT